MADLGQAVGTGLGIARVALFLAAALYAWATVWAFEAWHARRSRPLLPDRT